MRQEGRERRHLVHRHGWDKALARVEGQVLDKVKAFRAQGLLVSSTMLCRWARRVDLRALLPSFVDQENAMARAKASSRTVNEEQNKNVLFAAKDVGCVDKLDNVRSINMPVLTKPTSLEKDDIPDALFV